MRQIRHIVPGIYHREIKKATNYVRRTNGNKNRKSSIRTTYSSGGSSTSVPNIKVNSPIVDNGDDTELIINTEYLSDKFLVFSIDCDIQEHKEEYELIVDYGDDTVEHIKLNSSHNVDFQSVRMVHMVKKPGIFTIKIHHKGFKIRFKEIDYDSETYNHFIKGIISVKKYGLVESLWVNNAVENGFGPINLQEIPSLPFPMSGRNIEMSGMFANSKLKSVPERFFENAYTNHDIIGSLNCNHLFANSTIEEIPDNFFKPFTKIYDGELSRRSYSGMFEGCKNLKSPFPSLEYQPLNWKKTEQDLLIWASVFKGCTNMPNYKDIPPILRGDY